LKGVTPSISRRFVARINLKPGPSRFVYAPLHPLVAGAKEFLLVENEGDEG
jgi:hypothetical protein